MLGRCLPRGLRAAKNGVRSFGTYWINQMGPNKMSRYFADIATLTEAGKTFLDTERDLLALARQPTEVGGYPKFLVQHNVVAGKWERLYARLGGARALIQDNQKLLDSGKLQEKYDEIGASTFAAAEGAVKRMKSLTSLVAERGAREDAAGWAKHIAVLDEELGQAIRILRQQVGHAAQLGEL